MTLFHPKRIRNLCSAFMMALVLSPCTAPFQTFDFGDPGNGRAWHEIVVPLSSGAASTVTDPDGSVVPTMPTHARQLKQSPLSNQVAAPPVESVTMAVLATTAGPLNHPVLDPLRVCAILRV